MNATVEKITDYIERKLSGFGSSDRITIILEIREVIDRIEKEAMIEEYELDMDFFEQ